MVVPLVLNTKIRWNRILINTNQDNSISTSFWFFIILIFCVFDQTSGDYFHYRDDILEMQKYHEKHYGMEWIYNQLIMLFDYSYIMFRIFVWGGALIFYRKILTELKLHNVISYSLMALVLLRYFSYGRYALAVSMFLYGFVLLFNESMARKKIGILLVVFSVLFHKTIIVLFPLLFLINVPFNIFTVSSCVFAVPLIASIINNNIADYMTLLDPELNRVEIRYLNAEREYDNSIREIFMFYSYLLPLVFFLYKFYKLKKDNTVPKVYSYMFKLVLLIFYVVIILYFVDFGSASIYNRIRIISFYPICILVTYYISRFSEQGLSRSCLIMLLLLYLSDNVYYAYLLYLKTIGLAV